jgi:hypothetical protein
MRRRAPQVLLALTGLAIAGLAVITVDMRSPTITTYAATCLVHVEDGHCSAPGRTLEPATFTVSVERQQVWVSESGTTRVLASCSVQSKQNWRCRSSDDASELGIAGGRPWRIVPGGNSSDIYFMSKWRYFWMKSGETRPSGAGRAVFR